MALAIPIHFHINPPTQPLALAHTQAGVQVALRLAPGVVAATMDDIVTAAMALTKNLDKDLEALRQEEKIPTAHVIEAVHPMAVTVGEAPGTMGEEDIMVDGEAMAIEDRLPSEAQEVLVALT